MGMAGKVGMLGLALLLGACTHADAAAPAASRPPEPVVQVRTEVAPLVAATACTDQFVAHDLAHTTSGARDGIRLFDSNGSGVAVNDLDGDGLPEIAFANVGGPATLLWNQGQLRFRREELTAIFGTRAVAMVDVDGDGALELAFSSGVSAPAVLQQTSEGGWRPLPLPGVTQIAYAMSWADWDGDGDLDLATGSYDAGQNSDLGPNYLFSAGAGVNLYLQGEGGWARTQLDAEAQTLAISLWDLTADGHPDLWVGNDFDMPDHVWQQENGMATPARLFGRIPHSTMGIERGDVNNDGLWDYFATDMKPYQRDVRTTAEWLPLMETGYQSRTRSDPQRSENFLYVQSAGGSYANDAYARRIDATGWSWSGKFGDLDLDGDLDAYVVNGMIALDLLDHLPGGELVEENQARRNRGDGSFVAAPEWGLGSTRSGRGMSLADLDLDGDLDAVVNNLSSAAQLFENRLCSEGSGMSVELREPAGRNPYALGATVTVHTDGGLLMRDVRGQSGYLSGDTMQLHFGLPNGVTIERMEIRWNDGSLSTVESPPRAARLIVTRVD